MNLKYIYIIAIVIILAFLNIGAFFVAHQPEESPPPMPSEINPNFLAQINKCLIPVAGIYGYTLRVSSAWRSLDEQATIYNQGRTINGHIVSEAPAGKSIHNYGFAADIVDRWRGYDIDWKKLHNIGAYCRLENDISIDPPHFESRDGLTTAGFAVGFRPVTLTLPCPVLDERAKAKKPLTFQDLKNCGAPRF